MNSNTAVSEDLFLWTPNELFDSMLEVSKNQVSAFAMTFSKILLNEGETHGPIIISTFFITGFEDQFYYIKFKLFRKIALLETYVM